jgi:hypothetical protein
MQDNAYLGGKDCKTLPDQPKAKLEHQIAFLLPFGRGTSQVRHPFAASYLLAARCA